MRVLIPFISDLCLPAEASVFISKDGKYPPHISAYREFDVDNKPANCSISLLSLQDKEAILNKTSSYAVIASLAPSLLTLT